MSPSGSTSRDLSHIPGPSRTGLLAVAAALAWSAGVARPALAQEKPTGGPTIHHYDIHAAIDLAAARLEATATLRFVTPEPGTDALEYQLNASLSLDSVGASVPLVRVVRDTTRRGEARFLQMGEPIRLELAHPLEPGEPVEVTMRYHGGIAPDSWGTNVLEPGWFELASYAPWFPYVPGDRAITFTLDLDLPPGVRLAALGHEHRSGNRWRVVQETPVSDIVVAGGPALRADTVVSGKMRVILDHAGLRRAQLDQIADDVQGAVATYQSWIGPAPFKELEFLFSPRPSGGGYARPGFVVMQISADDPVDGPGFLRYLGHEVAHLWWSRAPTDGWEDWLNESWAEYTSLMLLRDRLGEAAMDERIAEYRRAADTVPPIRGLARDGPEAFEVLYRKGPVILHDLEGRLGRGRFLELMRAVRQARVRSTEQLLDIVGEVASARDRAWLAEELRS